MEWHALAGMHVAAATAAVTCMRACVVARVIGTMYQLEIFGDILKVRYI
jgi:hypothetical protein